MDKLRRLEIFATVAAAGRFNVAAEQLGLSTSAVSHAIRSLEDHLGQQLIRRDNRNFSLTDDGMSLLQEVQPLLDQFRELEISARQRDRELRGVIRVSAPVSWGTIALRPKIAGFLTRHPQVSVELDLSDRFVDLRHERFDMTIRITQLQDSNLKARRIGSIRMCLCASPSYVKAHQHLFDAGDLAALDTLIFTSAPEWHFVCNGKPRLFSPRGRLRTSSGEAIAAFAEDGMGLAYLPGFMVDHALRMNRLVRVMPWLEGREYGVYLLFPNTSHRPERVRALAEFITTDSTT